MYYVEEDERTSARSNVHCGLLGLKGFGKMPERLVQLHIGVDGLDGPCLGESFAVWLTFPGVTETATDQVLLKHVERVPESWSAICIASWFQDLLGPEGCLF